MANVLEILNSLGAHQRANQPPVLQRGAPIPADFLRADQPDIMQGSGPVDIQARVQEAMRGFALPDVSKYGYSPESQGRVEGAGYLRETPMGGSPSARSQDPMAEQAARVGAMDFNPQTTQAAPQQEPTKKPRMSIIDLIGSIGNAFSTGGGGEAHYRTEADRARDEQARMLKAQDDDLQRRIAQQKFQSGSLDMAADQNKIIAQSVRGLRAVYDKNPAAIGRAWDFVSSQLGVPEQRRAEIAQALASDPEGTLAVLEGAMGEQEKQGSQAKELQIYKMIEETQGKEAADAYLMRASGGALNANQEATIGVRKDTIAAANARAAAALRAAEIRSRRTAAGKGAGTGGAKLPAAVQKNYLENRDAMRQIAAAKESLKGRPQSVGARYAVMPDIVSQRTDPEGVATRARIANIGSLVIHDRSGATVTVAESPRLRPFIPSTSDTPEAADKKLTEMFRIMQENNADIEDYYSGNAAPTRKARPQGTLKAPPKKNPPASGGWGKAKVVGN